MVVTAAVAVAAYCGFMAVAACCGSVAVATCCDSVAVAALNGAPLVKAAALPVARGALDERRLVGTAASDLSTLAGARGARSASPCEHKGGKVKHPLLEDGVPRGAIPHLRVEKPRLLFLEGSTGAEGAAGVAAAAPPNASAAHAGTSAARAGTSAARATSIIDCLATGAPAPAPDACSLAASAALDEEGASSHLSRRARPPSSSSSSSPDDKSSEVVGGESPCYSRSRNSSSLCSRRSRLRILFSLLHAARSCSRCCTARTPGLGAWVDWTARRPRPSPARDVRNFESRRRLADK